jgi:cytochrome b561
MSADKPIQTQFTLLTRILHWLMAALLLAMLFIGAAMVTSLADYHLLVSIHRPLGIAIFLLVIVRFINRLLTTLPPFPSTMSAQERRIAHYSELLMYSLMFILPLVGWAMLSAGSYPIVLLGPLHLPPILPHNLLAYTLLRKAHTLLAYLFFFTILAHLTAVLVHTLVLRDGLLKRMLPWKS